MSKKTIVSILLLIPISILSVELCTPQFWRTAPPEEVDMGLFIEEMSESMANPDYLKFRNGEDVCIQKPADIAKVHTVCFNVHEYQPYCYYKSNTLLHLAVQFTNNLNVVDNLIDMGFDMYAVNDDGHSVESYSRINSASNIFDGMFFTVAQENTEDELYISDDLTLDYDYDFEETQLPPIPGPRRQARPRYSQRDLNLDYGLGEETRKGLYLNFGVGLTAGKGLVLNSEDNDIPDQCTDPLYAFGSAVEAYYLCKQGQNTWSNNFVGKGDITAGAAIGFKYNNIRIEAEGSVRASESEDSDIQFKTDRSVEFLEANESIGLVEVKTQFANMYVDFDLDDCDGCGKVKPFVGIGGGRILQRYKYNAYLLRTTDFEVLELFGRGPHTAGMSTRADNIFTNTVWGTQFLGGVNIPLNDKGDLTIKARYLRIPDVTNSAPWDILRNDHLSRVSILNDEVEYTQELRGRGLFDITAGFTIFF